MMGKHKIAAVAVFISNSAGEYLLMRRHGNAECEPGKWFVPGGKVDVGESIEACARREVREEIGCDLVQVRLGSVYPDISSRFVMFAMTATLSPGATPRCMEPHKHGPPVWLGPDSISNLRADNLMPGCQIMWFGGTR